MNPAGCQQDVQLMLSRLHQNVVNCEVEGKQKTYRNFQSNCFFKTSKKLHVKLLVKLRLI